MSSSKSRDSHPSGPDLMGKSSTAAGNHRILSQLEHGVAPPAMTAPPCSRPAWWRAAGAVLCVLLATVVILSMLSTRNGEEIAAATPAYADAAIGPAPAAMHAAAPAPAPAVQPTTPGTATIVNMASASAPPPMAVPVIKAAGRKTQETRAATSRPAPAASGDNDVALLTAMVVHAHRQDGGRTEPVRDVVVRKDEEETLGLLQRCKQLGLIEGMLCRSRICTGRWDSDPACY